MTVRDTLRATFFMPVDLTDPERRLEQRGISRNVSSSGLLASLTQPVVAGERWELCFSFPGVKVPIQCRAECIRCAEEFAPARQAPTFLAAFSFLDLDSSLAAQLELAVLGAARAVAMFLGDFEAFCGASGELLISLAGAFRTLPLRDGESCPAEWDLAGSLILIRAGLVKLSRPGFHQGRELVFLGSRGHVVGERALLAGEAHNLRLRALAPSQVLVLGPRSHAYLCREEPEVAAALTEALREIARQREACRAPLLMPLGLAAVGVGH